MVSNEIILIFCAKCLESQSKCCMIEILWWGIIKNPLISHVLDRKCTTCW